MDSEARETSLRSRSVFWVVYVGHALISAGMLTYAGPFTAAYRGELEAQWSELLRLHQLPFQPSCGLKQFLGMPLRKSAGIDTWLRSCDKTWNIIS